MHTLGLEGKTKTNLILSFLNMHSHNALKLKVTSAPCEKHVAFESDIQVNCPYASSTYIADTCLC